MTSPDGSLAGNVAVVTAGCAGLGLAVAQRLVEDGATVVATSRDPATVERCNDRWAGTGQSLTARHLDFDATTCDGFFCGVAETFGAVNILVNAAAGRGPAKTVEQTAPPDLLEHYSATVLTAFNCSQSVVKNSERTHIQSIVNIGSIYGVLAVDHRIYDDPQRQTPVAYACAKAALVQLTRYLAAYWGPSNIRVNCVSIGGVAGDQDEQFRHRYNARVPLGRMAQPSEAADVVAYLAGPRSSYITGSNIMVDGGLHAW